MMGQQSAQEELFYQFRLEDHVGRPSLTSPKAVSGGRLSRKQQL